MELLLAKRASPFLLLMTIVSASCNSPALTEAAELGMDEALLSVRVCGSTSWTGAVEVFAQNTNCWNCSDVLILKLHTSMSNANGSALLYANHSTVLNVALAANGNFTTLCSKTIAVEEHAYYSLDVNVDGAVVNSSCTWTLGSGSATNLPILYAFLALLGLTILWITILHGYRKRWCAKLASHLRRNEMGSSSDGLVSADLGTPSEKSQGTRTQPLKERFISLDVFRGISLTLMIFVNYGGGGYWFFAHSEWNGLTVADLLFPWFVFIMGMAVPFTQSSMVSRRTSHRQAFFKILKRCLILFVLGLLVNSKRGNDLSTIRVMGVLQRLALSYLVVAVVGLVSPRPTLTGHEGQWWSSVRDLVYSWPQILTAIVFLMVHIGVSLFIPFDSTCPVGYIGPGGLHDKGSYWNCTGGIARYIDMTVLGSAHMYHYPTCKSLYQCESFDPEGLFGTLTSVVLCFLGAQAGRIYSCYKPPKSRILRWFLWAVATGGLTLLLTKCSQDDGWVPINKNLWSASFILGVGCLGYLGLIILHIIIDVLGAWNGSPFYYAGVNSIAVYLGSEVLANFVPISFRVSDDHMSQLFMNMWSVTFFLLMAYYMHHKRLFISV